MSWSYFFIDVFDRLEFGWFGVRRQHLCMDVETGRTTWRRVKLFGGKKRRL